MVCNSLSILHSKPASFCSSCAINSTSTFSSLADVNFVKRSPRFLKLVSPYRYSSPPTRRIGVHARLSVDDDGSVEQFLRRNTVADFMRYKNGGADGGGGGKLQLAVVSYRKKFPWSILQPFLQVDLVSVIHIADKEYFATLQKKLESYDCVLYEMVTSRENLMGGQGPSGMRKLKASLSRGFSFIAFIQQLMARALGLDSQVECLDYQTEGWYHADLDIETFEILQVQKGESIFAFAQEITAKSTNDIVEPEIDEEELGPWRSKLLWASRELPMPLVGLFLIESVCFNEGSQTPEYPELEALSRLDFGTALKVFLARCLASDFVEETTGLEEGSVIVGERNKAATKVLQRAIDKGYKKIAILYGSGHMPDLGRRLREEFNLTPTQVQWIPAWSIRNPNLTSSSLPFSKTMAVFGWPLDGSQTLALLIFSFVLALDLCLWELLFGTTVDWISHISSDILKFVNGAQVL